MIHLRRQAANGETKPQVRSIRTSLLERTEQIIDIPARETAAYLESRTGPAQHPQFRSVLRRTSVAGVSLCACSDP